MSDRHVMAWHQVDLLRRGLYQDSGDDDSNTSYVVELEREDGAKLNCDSLTFEMSNPRAASSLFDAVLPVASGSLLRPGAAVCSKNVISCCIMRDSSARTPSLAVAAALLCCRSAEETEICGLAVRSAYRGFGCVGANLISYAVIQGVLRPGDKVSVHVQADNLSALRFYAATLAMRPHDAVHPPLAKKPREERVDGDEGIRKLSDNAAEVLVAYGVSAEELEACCVKDYYPPKPRCRFGSRHAFVIKTVVPTDNSLAVKLPWSPDND